MRRRKQQDIDLDLVHGLDAGNYDAAYVGGDWYEALKQRIKSGTVVTDEYEEAFIIGFISGADDHPMNYDEYSQAVARFGKRLQELGKHVSYGESDEDYDEEESGIRENPARQRRLQGGQRIFVRQEREKAKKFWESLSPAEKWELGDQLVLGNFDWRDWLNRPPSRVFLNEVDYLRLNWESGRE